MNLQFAIPRATFAAATKIVQAQAQSDRDALSHATAAGGAQRIAVGGLAYVWCEAPYGYGKDRGFWMLESSSYQALESGERLTLTVAEMAAKLIAAGEIANPAPMPREDESITLAQFAFQGDPGDEHETGFREGFQAAEDHFADRESIGSEAFEFPFAIGDVVALKSGGQKMTVAAIDFCPECDELDVHVSWFDSKNSVIKRDRLDADTLELV